MSRATAALLASLLVTGCDDAPASPAGEVRVDSLFSVVLSETDTAYTGRPNSLAVDPESGDFLISDGFGDRVLRYDRTGTLTAIYGERGEGPGQFSSAGRVVAVLDGSVVAADDGRSLLNVYARDDGAFVSAVPFHGTLGSIVADPDSGHIAWLGILDIVDGHSIGRWNRRTGHVEYGGAVPVEYRESNALAGIFNRGFVLPAGEHVLVAFQGDDRVYRLAWPSGEVDTLRVPTRLRTAHPPDVVEAMRKERAFPRLFSMIPALFGLYPLPEGRLLLVHFDQEIEGPSIEAEVYLSVLAPKRGTACIDLPLPLRTDVQPRLTVRGDTVFAVTQQVDEGGATTTVEAFLLAGGPCTTPLAPSQAAGP
ncbi:MAG: hypothetical protein RH859_01955 [Longimicrobiales bacterium]